MLPKIASKSIKLSIDIVDCQRADIMVLAVSISCGCTNISGEERDLRSYIGCWSAVLDRVDEP